MKKRVVALMCIVVLLLWPLAGCKKPNDPALGGALAGGESLEQVPEQKEELKEEQKEEKIYCTATVEDEFKPSEVILTLKASVSDPYVVSDQVNFSNSDYEYALWKNRYQRDASKGVDFSGYRQIFLISLRVRTKENVLRVIKELEALDYVYSAEPNYNLEEEFSVASKFGTKEMMAEEKCFCSSRMEQDFEVGKVLVLLTRESSDLYEPISEKVFSCVDYESVTWKNPYSKEAIELGRVNKETYRQRYTVVLKEKTKQAVMDAIKELEKLECVYSAEPNHIAILDWGPERDEKKTSKEISIQSLTRTSVETGGRYPNDDELSQQYAIEKMSLPAAWHISTGKTGTIKVGILDSGIERTHADFNIPIDRWGATFIEGDLTSPYIDRIDHGTHVAGIIGAAGNNGEGISGVGWNVDIYSLKVFHTALTDNGNISSTFDSEAVSDAINRANDLGFHILNFSGSTNANYASIRDAISDFDGLFIASAGNQRDKPETQTNNDNYPRYPGSYGYDKIIAVASTNINDLLAEDSHYGATSVDLAAPGVNIYSTLPGGNYGNKSGTSMATAQVTGVAALIWSMDPTLTADEVKEAIMNGVDPVSSLSGKCVTGGRLNAFKAVTYLLGQYNPPGVVSGDVTGDGLEDLVVSGSFNGKRKITVFKGKAGGGFGEAVHTLSEATFVYNDPLYIGDVNGDGRDDLVFHFAQNLRRAMAVYTAKGDGTFYERINFFSARTHNPTYYPCKLFLEDITGDGKADFIVHWRTDQGKRCFLVYKGYSNSNGYGTFYEAVQSTASVFNYADTDPAFMGDVNGDGRSDFVIHWSENNKRRLLTYTANADGTYTEGAMLYSARTHNPSVYPCSFHLADATGDGKVDFLVHWGDTAGKRNIMVYKGISSSGVANFEEGYYALSSIRAYVGTDLVYTGDFNGDGRTDQMVHYAINGIRNMLVYFANASGNYNEAVQISTTQQQNLTNYPCTVHIMDTDGDGKDDFAVRYRTTEKRTGFHVYKGTTSGFSASIPTTMIFFPYYIYY